ncbi:MAG: ANTAR domain-containing protein [Gammaproteobacteria bacterium]|nr:ANTAR domain-containing protein [Gammaproteobacteria bacterium]
MALRVMLIDQNRGRVAILEQALLDNGYEVVARSSVEEDLLQRIAQVAPDVIIVDMESPDRDTLESMRSISRDQPRPIVMFAEKSDRISIGEAVKAGVSAYVVDGMSPGRLNAIMEVAIARFREFQALRNELEETKSRLEDRKLIDKAKGILMKQKGMSEDEAYKVLRKMAMDRNIKIGEAARNVIIVADLLVGGS